jgi:beta-galactosidase
MTSLHFRPLQPGRFYFFFLFCVLISVSLSHLRAEALRVRRRMDDNWKFFLGDAPDFAQSDFNDSTWRNVTLPHDWSIEQKIDPAAPTGGPGGYYPTGVGWYREVINTPADWKGKQVQVEFEGVYMDADVFLNGQKLFTHPYGYTSFFVDLTPSLKLNARNILAVRVDNSHQKNTRFYSGSGIYRHVWLEVTNPVHVANWGVFVATTKADSATASLTAQVTIRNDSAEAQRVTIEDDLVDPQGQTIANISSDLDVPAGAENKTEQKLDITNPALWSPENPQLCQLITHAAVAGKPVDQTTTPFGIRKLAWSVTDGFTINGKSYKLKGGCIHQDNGILGACAFDRAEERKIQILKAAGYNAIRTAHNPPSPAILAACDRLGMMVMDESFDCWGGGKNKQDYSVYFNDWWQFDLTSMIMRDRNHPSVVFWSIGNEIPGVFYTKWASYAPKMASLIRALDPTRPITNAVAGWPVGSKPGPTDAENRKNADDLVWGTEDVVGTNYRMKEHLLEHDQHPDRILISTESSPPLGIPADTLSHPYVVGDFVWTAMEYLGESGLGRWFFEGDPTELLETPTATHPKPGPVSNQSDKNFPWHGSPSGNIDLLGNRKSASYLWNINWDAGEKLHLAVRQPTGGRKIIVTGWGWSPTWDSWTWPGLEGQPINVEVYSRYPRVRLYLNDKLLGENGVSEQGRFTTNFNVPYAPGTLKAVGLQDGKEAETCQLQTVGDPVAIRLTPDMTAIQADGQGLCYVKVEVVDKDGNPQPNADQSITFHLTGPGSIAGLGNADLKDATPYKGTQCRVFHGQALVILRSSREAGTLDLKASCGGLNAAEVQIKTQ